jgi:hypothetical protein
MAQTEAAHASKRTAKKPAAEQGPLDLTRMMPDQEWALYQRVFDQARSRGLRFAVGGGFAFSAYSGRWRNTKDLDLFVQPKDRKAMIEAVTAEGFNDYYDQLPYDRKWIYRGIHDGTIVDTIWQMANYRTQVAADWLTRGPEVKVSGQRLQLLPLEELVWTKLYVLQRERCDWPDLLNLLHARGQEIDWEHLLNQIGEDAPVLGGVLSLFGRLCPGQARELPAWLWGWVGLRKPRPGPDEGENRHRVALLDTRDWFGPTTNGR